MTETHEFFFTSAHPLSQWYPAKFYAEGMWFDNAEHYMMWRKASLFNDNEVRNKLITCPSPKEAKALGRQVKNFDPWLWDHLKKDIVTKGSLHKFTSSKFLLNYLRATGTKKLVEASPWDKIWGIGLSAEDAIRIPEKDWPGRNLLGHCLMDVREIIQRCA